MAGENPISDTLFEELRQQFPMVIGTFAVIIALLRARYLVLHFMHRGYRHKLCRLLMREQEIVSDLPVIQ